MKTRACLYLYVHGFIWVYNIYMYILYVLYVCIYIYIYIHTYIHDCAFMYLRIYIDLHVVGTATAKGFYDWNRAAEIAACN